MHLELFFMLRKHDTALLELEMLLWYWCYGTDIVEWYRGNGTVVLVILYLYCVILTLL